MSTFVLNIILNGLYINVLGHFLLVYLFSNLFVASKSHNFLVEVSSQLKKIFEHLGAYAWKKVYDLRGPVF